MKGVFLIGPSGSGKTTLAHTLSHIHSQYFGEDSAIIINLDSANEGGEIDICKLVRLEEIMEQLQLGPNGALIYASELLESNIEWLFKQIEIATSKRNPSSSLLRSSKAVQNLKLSEIQTDNILLIFDLPGQAELYLSNDSLKNTITGLINHFNLQTCFLELFDATYLYNLKDFTSMIMMSLSTICHIQIPHICLLNKIDLCKGRRPADGSLCDYFGLPSLRQLLADNLDLREQDNMLNAIAGIVDEFSQVTFSPCSIQKPDLILALLIQLEKIFGTLQNNLLSNKKFANEAKEFLSDVGSEGLRVNLQAQLFSEEEEIDYQEELRKIRNGL